MKTIVILNLKGGVGKTTTATNLAYELSNIGETLLIDADKQGNSTEFYNIHDFTHGLGDVLTAKTAADACALHAALPALNANGKPYPHLRILPSDYRLMKSNISLLLDTSSGRDKRLRRYLAENEGVLEFVVVDCAPDIDMASINALMAADLAIVPITLDKNARKGLAEVWEQIEAAQQENPKLKAYALITRFRPDQKEKIADVTDLDLLGTVIRESTQKVETETTRASRCRCTVVGALSPVQFMGARFKRKSKPHDSAEIPERHKLCRCDTETGSECRRLDEQLSPQSPWLSDCRNGVPSVRCRPLKK